MTTQSKLINTIAHSNIQCIYVYTTERYGHKRGRRSQRNFDGGARPEPCRYTQETSSRSCDILSKIVKGVCTQPITNCAIYCVNNALACYVIKMQVASHPSTIVAANDHETPFI